MNIVDILLIISRFDLDKCLFFFFQVKKNNKKQNLTEKHSISITRSKFTWTENDKGQLNNYLSQNKLVISKFIEQGQKILLYE